MTFATASAQPRVILDSGASVSIVNDLALLHSVHAIFAITVNGVGGSSQATQAGEFGGFGPALYLPNSPQNILSTAVLFDYSGFVSYEPDPDNAPLERARVQLPKHEDLLFKRVEGLYFCEFPVAWLNQDGTLVMPKATPRSYPAFPILQLYDSDATQHFTAAEVARAEEAGRLHRAMHHPNDRYLSTVLDLSVLRDTTLSSKDLRNHRLLSGPCTGCLTGKTRQPSSLTPSNTTYALGELLVGDLFYFYGKRGKKEPYLIMVESRTTHIMVTRMAKKTTSELCPALSRIVSFYKGHGHTVKYIRTDREPNLLSCEDFLLTLGVVMQHTGTNCHAKQAERAIQTLKSHCRATKCSLGFSLPQELHQHLILDVAGALNDITNVNCSPSNPNILITGARASCSKQYRVPFGTFGTVKTPPSRERDDLPRAVLAMCVGRDHASQKSLKVWLLHSRQIIHITSFTSLAITKDLIAMMDNYCAQEPQFGEDLLGGFSERATADPLLPSLTDVAHHLGDDDDLTDHTDSGTTPPLAAAPGSISTSLLLKIPLLLNRRSPNSFLLSPLPVIQHFCPPLASNLRNHHPARASPWSPLPRRPLRAGLLPLSRLQPRSQSLSSSWRVR